MKPIKPLYVVIIAVVLAIAGFFGGMQYQKSQRSATFAQFGAGRFGQRGQNARFAGRNGQNVVTGDIVSSDANSVTVKLQDGSSKIVILSSNTAINKQTSGSKSDLKSGERVAVIGTANSDGSVTAQSIQLNPEFRGMPKVSPAPTQ